MTQRFYTDQGGRFIGSWDGAEPPAGAVEVTGPPTDITQLWDGQGWGPPKWPRDSGVPEASLKASRNRRIGVALKKGDALTALRLMRE